MELKKTSATLDELVAQDELIGDGIKQLTKNRKTIRAAIKALQKLDTEPEKKKKSRRKKSAPAVAAA